MNEANFEIREQVFNWAKQTLKKQVEELRQHDAAMTLMDILHTTNTALNFLNGTR